MKFVTLRYELLPENHVTVLLMPYDNYIYAIEAFGLIEKWLPLEAKFKVLEPAEFKAPQHPNATIYKVYCKPLVPYRHVISAMNQFNWIPHVTDVLGDLAVGDVVMGVRNEIVFSLSDWNKHLVTQYMTGLLEMDHNGDCIHFFHVSTAKEHKHMCSDSRNLTCRCGFNQYEWRKCPFAELNPDSERS